MGISPRYLAAILGVVVLGVSGLLVAAVTWTSYTVTMSAATSNTAMVGVFSDCLTTSEVTDINWNGITQGYTYEYAVFIRNKGTVDLYITYSPTHVFMNNDQTHFELHVMVTEFGLPCQLSTISAVNLPEKDAANPTAGYLLPPGKVVKVDITLFVHSVWLPPQTPSNSWEWLFNIEAANAPIGG